MHDIANESFNLDEYTLDVESFFNDYIIHKKKFKKDYAVFQGVMKDSPQAVKIYKRLFPTDLESRQRFQALMTAFQQGVILADNIFLAFENGRYYIYVVEPSFSSYQDKFIQLSHLLKLDLDYFKKHRLFPNLVIMLKSLHALGEPHMEICPKNIWVEDQFLVYLRPFKLKIENQNQFNWRKLEKLRDVNSSLKYNNNSKYWYMAPEQVICDTEVLQHRALTNPQNQIDGFASDIWSLGCIFAEMFVSLTPVFQSVDSFDRTIRFFEVLGVPQREDVYYMNKELYNKVIEHLHSRTFNEDEFPLIQELVKNLSKNEEKMLTSLLVFNPNKRPHCDSLIDYPFFKTFTSKKPNHEESNAKNNFNQLRSLIGGASLPTEKSARTETYYDKYLDQKDNNLNRYSSKRNSDSLKARQNSENWWNLDLTGLSKEEQFNTKVVSKLSNRLDDQRIRSKISTMPMSSLKKENRTQDFYNGSHKASYGYYEKQDTRQSDHPLVARINTENNERAYPHIDKENLSKGLSFTPSGYKTKGSLTSRNKTRTPSGNNPINFDSSPAQRQNTEKDYSYLKRDDAFQGSAKSSMAVNSIQKRQKSFSTGPKVRLCISIETLKNLSTRYPQGSYSCRVDLKQKTTQGEPLNLFSHFTEVANRSAKLDFKGEVDLDLDSFLASFNQDPLKIYTFCRNSLTEIARGGSDVFLYGVSVIDMSLLLMNNAFETGTNNEKIKTISGWYHIYDPDDHYRTLGQMKIEIACLILSKSVIPRVPPSSSRDTRNRTNLDLENLVSQKTRFDETNTRPSGRSLSSTHVQVDRMFEDKKNLIPKPVRKISQPIQQNVHDRKLSVFETIQTDLSKLNDNLRKEQDKRHSMSGRIFSQGHSELGVTLQRLRNVLEDNQYY